MMKKIFAALVVVAATFLSVPAFAQGGCIQFPIPPALQTTPNSPPTYLVALGSNASGFPVTADHIYTDNTLGTEITQGTGISVTQPSGTPLNICALPGAYTLQFKSSAGGSGYVNYNIFIPPDTTKVSASALNIVDPTDNTKKINFTASGMTTGKALTIAGASANSRTYTLPDAGGAATFMFTNSTTAQNLLASAFNIADGTDTTKQVNFTASGNTTGKVITLAAASANSRTYTLGDNGGNGSFNVFSSIPSSVQQPPLTVFLTGSAYTNATTTFSNVTGLAFPVAASTNYHAICRITWQGSAGTTGPKYQFTGPASPTAVAVGMNSIVTATTVITASATAFSSAVANSGTVTTATNFTDTVDVSVLNGVNAGTVQLQAAANGAGTLTIQPGSYCTVQ